MADDDDLLFQQLTKEEIDELSELIDPDNEMLPPSERMPLQTTKKASEPFDRQHLLTHLKKAAVDSKVGEDYVPYIPKHKPQDEEKKKRERAEEEERRRRSEKSAAKSAFTSEFDDILAELSEADVAELAGEMGLHGLLNQAQSRGDAISSYSGYEKRLSAPPDPYDFSNPPQNTNLQETINSLERDDPALTELNLNNHAELFPPVIHQVVAALENNTYLESLSMAHVKFNDNHAASLAEVLSQNRTLEVLNLESNQLSGKGIKALLKALAHNKTLKQLRLANQSIRGGLRVEADIARLLEPNTGLVKFGYSFDCSGPRVQVERIIMRNVDAERKKRLLSEEDYDDEDV